MILWSRFATRTCSSRNTSVLRSAPCSNRPTPLSHCLKGTRRRKLFTSRGQNDDDLYLYSYSEKTMRKTRELLSSNLNPIYSWPGFVVRFSLASALLSGGFFVLSYEGFNYAHGIEYFRNLIDTSAAPVTTTLVGLNVLLFVAKRNIPSLTPILVRYGYLRLDLMAQTRALSTPLTPLASIFLASFSHRDAWHLFMNAFSLYNLGSFIEAASGSTSILELYAVCSSTGVIGSLLLHRTHLPTLGASAVAFGMLSFLAATRDHVIVSPIFLPMIQMDLETVTWGTAAFSVFGIVRGMFGKRSGGLDHAGHLGGLVGGWLVAYYGGYAR